MSDGSNIEDENNPILLSDKFIHTWYQDKQAANVLGARMVDLFGRGVGADFLNNHYDRIFTNLNFTNIGTPTDKLKIGILCFPHYVDFRPQEVIDGKKFSGSEEALIYMSNVLSSRGHRVVVYANITPKSHESLKPHNPRYLPLQYFEHVDDSEGQFDIVICWRMYEFERAKKRGKRVYLWVQDLPPNFIDTKHLDGALYLSDYQRDKYENTMNHPVPYVISGNGMISDYYSDDIRKDITRIPHSCFYGSNYGKGLKILLECWGNILERFPDATLHICFGRTNWSTITDGEMDYLVSLIEKYPSVIEHGRLSNAEVAKKMMECSIFSYPITHKSATFEITVVQAQCAGCIPAIIWDFCIPEVTHDSAYHCDDKDNYLNTLLEALDNEDKVDRQKFIDWGRQFTWERVADLWFELLSS